MEPFYTNVCQNYSSRYPDYPPMVSKNTFKNEDRDKSITICLGVEDVEGADRENYKQWQEAMEIECLITLIQRPAGLK